MFHQQYFQSISIYDQKICHQGQSIIIRCNLIQKSMVTLPSNFLINTLNDLNNVFKNKLSTSGRIVKDLEETSKRFNSIKKGFNFFIMKKVQEIMQDIFFYLLQIQIKMVSRL